MAFAPKRGAQSLPVFHYCVQCPRRGRGHYLIDRIFFSFRVRALLCRPPTRSGNERSRIAGRFVEAKAIRFSLRRVDFSSSGLKLGERFSSCSVNFFGRQSRAQPLFAGVCCASGLSFTSLPFDVGENRDHRSQTCQRKDAAADVVENAHQFAARIDRSCFIASAACAGVG